MRAKSNTAEKIAGAVNITLLLLLCLSILLPFANILALSFNDGTDSALGGISIWPREFTWANYQEVFHNDDILQSLKISVLRTGIGTALSVLLTAMAAFALKKKTLPGRNVYMFFIVFTMLFGGGIVPYYMVLKSLYLTNTFWVYIIPALYSAWNIILMRTFFQSIDDSLEESAKIDGAGDYKVFFRIILPLSLPVLAVIGLFNAVGHWNDWYAGTFFVKDKDLYPLQTLLKQMLDSAEAMRKKMMVVYLPGDPRQNVTGESLKMATLVVATLPIVCVYPFVQRYFVKGLMIGSVKG